MSETLHGLLTRYADPNYKAFQCRLMPGVNPDTVIGVRMPQLRRLAADWPLERRRTFLDVLPHAFYEENLLHAILLCRLRDVEETIWELQRFLPYIDNWAVCDSLRPRCFRTCPPPLSRALEAFVCSPHPYTVRFAIEMWMVYYLGDAFTPTIPAAVARVERDHYYVQMMQAWYFATALAVQEETILPYLQERRLAPTVHGMAVRKVLESRRISQKMKAQIRVWNL